MSAIQLSFSLRVSSGVKTVHLLGSWDGYAGQLPLSKDRSASKSGTWKGTFRFQNSTLEAGRRYWYYYIVDGYHVAHNPGVASTTEPTTGRELNILDVPADKSQSSSSSSSSSSHSRHPKGRPLSMSQIKAPKPVSPNMAKHILDSDYDTLEELTTRFGSTGLDDYSYQHHVGMSPVSSTGSSSLSYRSDGSSSPGSSRSGYSTPNSDLGSCTCERYGITRKGERVKLDCGGRRCGYGEESSCSSGASDGEREPRRYTKRSQRRNGIVVR
ncbi:GTP-binding protein EsdC [Ophiocordyceps camponoti-floridani]|uniref:GTP-binding protein EsdC n=1 Tax=Ophiocordyceps camponoti-floridani TaxID=2030778 RepID=A0A8H4Q9N3_9HYPO|nr:GTP-binding protein EsdC [Ophiocordyceps camponoti-floridani]